MITTPHFAYPFRFYGTSFLANDQGTTDDILACVVAVILYEPGVREMLPEFGLDDLTFQTIPLNSEEIVSIVERWEPRARTAFEQNPNLFDPKILNARLLVSTREA